MKKVLLFGATGMAGHIAYYFLRDTGKYDITNVVYRTPLTEDSIIVDVTDGKAVAEVVRKVKPEIILNCVGVLIRGSKEHPDNAILINAYFPHLLKTFSDSSTALSAILFLSSSGNATKSEKPWAISSISEGDATNPISFFLTKSETSPLKMAYIGL